MKIVIVTPAAVGSRKGNRITAERWTRFLRTDGHRVKVVESLSPNSSFDLLIAIHAVKSHPSLARYHREQPGRKSILILSGTDLYPSLSPSARRSLQLASHLVVLQPAAVQSIPASHHGKTQTIFQSATKPRLIPAPLKSCFEVTVVGHMRPVKDPFRAVAAAGLLPEESRIRISHLGQPLTDSMRKQIERYQCSCPRYEWKGLLPHWKTKQRIARSRLMINSSRSEGGASVIGESLVSGTPVLASRIDGNIGQLGEDYSGYFEFQDTQGLSDLMLRCEQDSRFYKTLVRQTRLRSKIFQPSLERKAITQLVNLCSAQNSSS